jgi:hypothetical protein
MKFTDIDHYGAPSYDAPSYDAPSYDAPSYGASFLANMHARKCQMEQRAVVRFLILKSLKSKEIEMELISVYGDEVLQNSP